ncbi:hypothetical protein ABQY58_025190 (plasmid) [Xanthomonas hortorum pv. hederae]|uniref:hypothetical protein n=1 Tax=Xanthomonas hortorum TaxID=56454 RepID=UPI0032E8B142
MNTQESDQLDPLITSAFAVVRYLSQLSEALALHPCRTNRLDEAHAVKIFAAIATCADRAEHIAQDFATDVLGGWSAKRSFIQHQLRVDLTFMLHIIDDPYFYVALPQSRAAYPTKERLQTLLAAVDQIRRD